MTYVELASGRPMSETKKKRFALMRRLMLEQMVYFLTEAGHSREDIQRDLREIMALPPGTKPGTKAPMMPLESLAYGEVLSAWANEPEYSDSSGAPALLPFTTRKPGQASFVKLCKLKHPRLDPKRVLEELKRYGAVVETDRNELKMTESYVRLNRNDTESAMYSVMLLADLLHTMTLNRKNKLGLFQRCAWTDTMDPAYYDQFRVVVHDSSLLQLKFFDKRMMEHDVRNTPKGADTSAGPRKKGMRVMVGIYMSADPTLRKKLNK